uniref:Carboxylesterase type B domain-containing protein n=1 Tax=Parascaris univalens TaxID=6257 RepID=A0A915A7H0_PARUN
MYAMWWHYPLLLIASCILRAASSGHSGLKTVTTTFGVLRGETVSPDVGDLSPVTQYLGVPYGVAPSGQYRFNMAISAAKWTHLPKDANKLSSVCIQSGIPELSEAKALKMTSAQRYDHMHRLLLRLKPQSEDCLYMNLFVPERIEPSRTQLPVLVIVHGDDYGWNSGNPYNGTIIASFGQIIVVTLNYRLGVFGFLGRCESSSCSGNSGLSDLVAALKMLSNTLPAFGGDSSSVTLLGWGSGAALVSLLMASPITQPNNRLFRRAILLDGSALSPWAVTENPQPFFFQLAEHLKCVEPVSDVKRTSREQRSIDTIVRCMQDHGPDNITRAAQRIAVPTFLSAFAPIVDGQMVPNKPSALFGSQFGSLFRDVDLMVGVTSNPAHHLLSNEDLRHGIDKERREKIFRTLVRNLYDFHRTEILAAILNEYTDWDNPKDHPKTIRNGVLSALSDVLFIAPTVETARLHSLDENHRDSNTFMFVFSHETRQWLDEQPNSGIRGSISGDHIPYILGYPLSNKNKEEQLYSGFNADDRGVARVMMHFISNFVKSGDPSKPVLLSSDFPIEERFHSTAWPQFNQVNREPYLEISDRPRVKNYYRNAQVGFWNGFVPQLHKGGREGVSVPEEHNFLPNHFKRDSFFGTVRPYGGYANDPFPPPPLPPTPLPKDLKKLTTPKPTVPPPPTKASTPAPFVNVAQNSTMLSVTVAVGCGLLFLNICIGFGLYRQCNKREESKKKLQLQYQTYVANHQPGGDINYSLNSSMNQQEPLLSSNNKGPTVPVRPGVSPTCPRHGRAAMALASGRNNAMGVPNSGPTLEEIQV